MYILAVKRPKDKISRLQTPWEELEVEILLANKMD